MVCQSVSSGGVKVEVTHCIGWGRYGVEMGEVGEVHTAHNIFLYQIFLTRAPTLVLPTLID